jgi:hypothetical protein
MTIGPVERRQQALDALDKASRRAEKLFATVDPALFDGYQTAHDVLANLVFWQCEHINVVRALLDERQPELKEGTFAALNAEACACQRAESMTALLGCFQTQRAELAGLLNQVADWRMDYPIKQGGRPPAWKTGSSPWPRTSKITSPPCAARRWARPKSGTR